MCRPLEGVRRGGALTSRKLWFNGAALDYHPFHHEETETPLPRYLISFDDGTMNIAPDELGDVSDAAHEVVRCAQDAGVWIFGGGLHSQRATIVTIDGHLIDGPYPETKAVVGGFSIVDVPSREAALEWAAKFAAACRCAQEVREIMFDPLA